MKKIFAKNKILILFFLLLFVPIINRYMAISQMNSTDTNNINMMNEHFESLVNIEKIKTYLRKENDDFRQNKYSKDKRVEEAISYLKTAPLSKMGKAIVAIDDRKARVLEEVQALRREREEFMLKENIARVEETTHLLEAKIEGLMEIEVAHFLHAKDLIVKANEKAKEQTSLYFIISLFFYLLIVGLISYLVRKVSKNHESALEAVKSRDNILSIVSHDLKNPLATIILNADYIVRTDKDNARLMSRVKSIKSSACMMRTLIISLLDHAKIESGQLKLELKAWKMSDIICQAEEMLNPLAAEKKITIKNVIEEEKCSALCDKDRLLQIFSNLIGNSIKFMDLGGEINVEVKRKADKILVSVSDNGPGISKEDLPYLFERFWQAKGTAKAGTGLGLSIVKGLVEAHGERIWVESRPGLGTTFNFTLSPFSG